MIYIRSLRFFLLFLPSFFLINFNAQINPNGYNKFYYENGTLSSEGYMVDGKPEGYWKTYSEKGVLVSEGYRKNHLLDSTWIFYTQEGKKREKVTYSAGKKFGAYILYDGEEKPLKKINYSNDTIQGEQLEYHANGNIKKKLWNENGKFQGHATEYDSNGNIITLFLYRYGVLTSMEKINRYDALKKKTGIWKTFFPSQNDEEYKIKTECLYKNGLKNGFYKEYDRNGSLIVFEKYENGNLIIDSKSTQKIQTEREYHDNGKLKVIGGYKKGQKEGLWQYFNEEGKASEAKIYKDGRLLGEGPLNPEGQYNGKWKHYYLTGELYSEGSYVKGVQTGYWVYYFVDGTVEQKGKFNKKGKFTDEWLWFHHNGEIHREEVYYEGTLDGPAIEYDSLGVIITKGSYSEDMKVGEWFYKVGDHKEVGTYVDDLKSGVWIHEYDNENIQFKGEFIDGLPNGKHLYYFNNGVVKKSERWVMGMEDGTFVEYTIDGTLILTEKYKMGELKKVDGLKVKQIN